MAEMDDFNTKIIKEFRENGGVVGPPFEGALIVILHTTGAKSGQVRENPVVAKDLGGGSYAVFASKGGAPTSPDWYHNIVANPAIEAEIGTETVPLSARVADPAEREEIWVPWKTANPGFAEYEAKTTRTIPVVILEPAS
jgi:deazaflavin-dependent oxidoreductase (nitroreductase family)